MCADLAMIDNTAILALCRNKMTGAIESEETIPAGISFEQYLSEYVPACTADTQHLFSVACNGQPWPCEQWHQLIAVGDQIVVTVEPQGAEVVYIAIMLASAYYSYRMSQNIPDNYSSTSPSSSSVYSVNAQGNQPKLMGKVPRLYGKAPFVPYYLSKPRREYVTDENGTREVLYLLFHLTKGQLDADNTTWYIGETPTTSLRSNITTRIHGPGADIGDDPAHLVQFSSDEVADTELPGPVYSQEWRLVAGGDFFAWGIYLADSTRLTLHRYTYNGDGTITLLPGQVDWLAYLNDDVPSYGDPVGHVFEFFGTAANNGFYRLISNNSGDNAAGDPVFQKLNDDLTDDTSWTGFVSEGATAGSDQAFIARWRLWGNDSGYGYLPRQYIGAYSGTPSSQVSQIYKLDFRYTGGLCRFDGNGDPQALTVQHIVQYREVGTFAWTSVTITHTGQTANELIITESITTAGATRLEIRVSYLHGGRDTTYRDDCQWIALRSEMPSPTSYPGWTVGSMIIEGAAELADVAEGKVWLESCAVLPELAADENGEPYWTDPVATQQRAAVIGQVHRDHGFADSMLDMQRLLEIQQVWDSWGDTFDYYEDDKATYWDKLTRYLAVGLCSPTLDYGKVVPVLDESQSGYAQVFGRSNVTKPIEMEISHSRGSTDEKDGIDAEWMNPVTRKSATVTCAIGDDAASNTEKVVAYGCIREEQAEFYGLYKRAVAKFRRRSFKWGTDMRGFASRYGDRVGVAPSFPGYSQSGRITALNGNVVTLSWMPNWSLENQLTIERPDGTGYGPVVVTQGATPYDVVLPAALDWDPEFTGRVLEPLATFGRIIPALIQSAKPNDMQTASIEAVIDDPRMDPYRVPSWL